MKKTRKAFMSRAMAIMTAAAAVSMSAVPAFAATTAVKGTTTTFDKYVVMKRNANVPNATFNYTVSIPTDAEMNALANPEDTNGTNLTVRKGIGTPTVSATTFAAGQKTYDAHQKTRTNKSSTAYDAYADDAVDGLDDSHKYAKVPATIDFSSITYSEPGVYRYKVTENNTDEKGITKDSTARFVDIYIESDDSGKLSVAGYVFHTVNATQAKGDSANLGSNNPDGKNKGFTNQYETKDITLTKTVTGNQGYRDQYFKFHVDITDLDGGARLFVTDSAGSRTIYKSDNNVAYAYNATTGTRTAGQKRFVASKGTFADITSEDADAKGLAITADSSGAMSFDVYLKHGETVKLNGLTKGAKYTVTETSEDYSASATKNSSALTLTHDKSAHTDATAAQTLAEDETVAFTNSREGFVPTGLVYNNKAACAIGGIAIAGGAVIIAVVKKRKENEKKFNIDLDSQKK